MMSILTVEIEVHWKNNANRIMFKRIEGGEKNEIQFLLNNYTDQNTKV